MLSPLHQNNGQIKWRWRTFYSDIEQWLLVYEIEISTGDRATDSSDSVPQAACELTNRRQSGIEQSCLTNGRSSQLCNWHEKQTAVK